MRQTIISALLLALTMVAKAQTIAPQAEYSDNGTPATMNPGDNYKGPAPLTVTFHANPECDDTWTVNYEWRFTLEGQDEPYLIRYDKDTEYTFVTAGAHHIVCYVIFTRGDEREEYTEEYWNSADASPFNISIEESDLIMPNAFTPNGDGHNEVYHAKSYKSLVEFRAIIFNRWGTKIYEWNDPAGGWNGKYKGKDMPQGVYFVYVRARGADGRVYNIKKDVNLLRGFSNITSSSSTDE